MLLRMNSLTYNSQTNRNQRTDLLRGIAILLVLILHFHLAYDLSTSLLGKIFSAGFITALARNGNYGVTMFFVISGFLITTTTLQRFGELGKIKMVDFYIFRFARIMPCLLLALALIVVFSFTSLKGFANKANSTSLFIAVLSVLTFWHNYLMIKLGDAGYFNYCLNILWSLSVEEVFYITFPILCLLFKRTRFLVIFWIGLIILAPIYRSFYQHNEIVALYGYLSCFDGIAIGCCAALLVNKMSSHALNLTSKYVQYAAMLLIAVVYLSKGIMQNVVIGVSAIALCTAILLTGGTRTACKNKNTTKYNIFNNTVCWFGRNSYEIYLFHIIILALLRNIFARSNLGSNDKILLFIAFLLITALVSGLIAKYYSIPANKKLRTLFHEFYLRHKKTDLLVAVPEQIEL